MSEEVSPISPPVLADEIVNTMAEYEERKKMAAQNKIQLKHVYQLLSNKLFR